MTDFDWLEYADIERKRVREFVRYDTFEYSGDLEWATWREGVLCCSCRANDLLAESKAIGVSMFHNGDEITVSPVCASCADGKNIMLFGRKEDN